MKKLTVVLFVALLGLALAVPASALEHEFGGYWRVRMYHTSGFSGQDDYDENTPGYDEDLDGKQLADTRTRLYYTAIINENLKFVNKFEMDAVWGDSSSYGDIGADAVAVEVKNTYVDFNYGPANIQLGTQGQVIHRGLMFDDDFSGVTFGVAGLTGMYMKVEENGNSSGDDDQVYHLNYAIGSDTFKITPNLTYDDQPGGDSMWFAGLDVDGNAGALGYWGTFIYQGGEQGDDDRSAYLVDVGVTLAVTDAFEINVEGFYATGDDDATDGDLNAFESIPGRSYYWSEIMGLGVFDDYTSNASPGDYITNIMAANLGASMDVTEKLTLSADLWYAQLAEDDANGNKDLGTEIDLSAAYTIIEGMRLHAVAAYLFAGDATTGGVENDADPFEIGAQFSISF